MAKERHHAKIFHRRRSKPFDPLTIEMFNNLFDFTPWRGDHPAQPERARFSDLSYSLYRPIAAVRINEPLGRHSMQIIDRRRLLRVLHVSHDATST